tara:strand:- start:72 stop:521 length:450 start_codon:yes stop_codon:yes gene_type:complete
MSDIDFKGLNPVNVFRDALLFTAVPAYTAMLIFGILVGQVAVGSLFMVVILVGQYALKKTMTRCDISINELKTLGIYSASFYTILILSSLHFLTNLLFAEINNPASSFVAFLLCYLMLFISVQTHVWFSYLHERRKSKKQMSTKKKSKK